MDFIKEVKNAIAGTWRVHIKKDIKYAVLAVIICVVLATNRIAAAVFSIPLYFVISTFFYFLLVIIQVIITQAVMSEEVKVMKQYGRYSQEYISILKEKLKESKGAKEVLYKMELAECYSCKGEISTAYDILQSADIKVFTYNNVMKALYFARMALLYIELGEAESANAVMEDNRELIKNHIGNPRFGLEINYAMAAIDYKQGNYEDTLKKLKNKNKYRLDPIDKVRYNKVMAVCYIKQDKKALANVCIEEAKKELVKADWWDKNIEEGKIEKLEVMINNIEGNMKSVCKSI